MKHPFNTPFELSLRVLLNLSLYQKALSLDKILFIDFLTTYGANFGLTQTNLHGSNAFYIGELAVRRSQIQSALKDLTLKNLVLPEQNKKGFSYLIHPEGEILCKNFSSTYAKVYLENAEIVKTYSENKTDTQLLRLVHSKASLKENIDG